METLIELYDHEAIDNILAVLAFEPKRVIYIGQKKAMTPFVQKNLRQLAANRGLSVAMDFVSVNVSSFSDIQKTLETIAKRYPNCVFDATGGTDLLLLAVGIFCYQHGFPVFHFNNDNLVPVINCDLSSLNRKPVKFSTADIFLLHGGLFWRHGHFTDDMDSEEMQEDVMAVWKVFLRHQKNWSKQVTYLQQVSQPETVSSNNLIINAPVSAKVHLGSLAYCDRSILNDLHDIGLIQDLSFQNNRIRFSYKNDTIRRCLCDAGIWLELYIYVLAKQMDCFDDVQMSVIVDWDGDTSAAVNTINEIDVVLVKGTASLFISCKIGVPNVLAVNEIDTLTRRFGGKRAKPVLITTASLSRQSPAIAQRAADMDVAVLEVAGMPREALEFRLKQLMGF